MGLAVFKTVAGRPSLSREGSTPSHSRHGFRCGIRSFKGTSDPIAQGRSRRELVGSTTNHDVTHTRTSAQPVDCTLPVRSVIHPAVSVQSRTFLNDDLVHSLPRQAEVLREEGLSSS